MEAEESQVVLGLLCSSRAQREQSKEDLQQAADLREESEESSTLSSSMPPSQNYRSTFWWARKLKQHTRNLTSPVENQRPILVVSACSGSLAEAEVLKACS